jgi:hypothetical protein
MGYEGVDWIQLVRDGVQWQAFVKTVMSLWVPQREEIPASWAIIKFSKEYIHDGVR